MAKKQIKKLSISPNPASFLRTALHHVNDIVIFLSKEGIITEFNRAAEFYYGIKRDHAINMQYEALCKQSKKDVIFSIKKHEIIEKRSFSAISNFNAFFVQENDEENNENELIIEWSFIDLVDLNNDSVGVILQGNNVTEKVKFEMKDKNIQEYLESISSCMPGNFYWKDKEGRYLGCNNALLDTIGFISKAAIVGKNDFDLWPNQAKEITNNDKKVMKSGKILYLEEWIDSPLTGRKDFTAIKMPLLDRYGNIAGVLCNSLEITELKKTQAELKKEKEKAEATNLAKTEFLENIRHDLRTPLSGIIGFSNLIKSEADKIHNEKIAEFANGIHASSEALLELLNEVLETMRITSGDKPLLKKKFNLKSKLEQIVKLNLPKAYEKHLVLTLDYDDNIPKWIVSDPHRIQRIVLDLLANALKFTNEGKVIVSVKLGKIIKEDREAIVKIAISDTGIGIPAEKREEIFERFKRLMPSFEGTYKGLGLGLAIVKQFVDDLEGEIYLESEINKGSTFTCTIPLKIALLDESFDVDKIVDTEPKPAANSNNIMPNMSSIVLNVQEGPTLASILLVEDQEIAVQIGRCILEGLGCSVDIAKDGKQAVMLATSTSHRYDLIIMDIGLPLLDGVEATKEIRRWEATQDNFCTPIVALTAHIDAEHKQRCLDVKMQTILSKPFTKELANQTLKTYLPDKFQKIKNFSKPVLTVQDEANNEMFTNPSAILDLQEAALKTNGNLTLIKELLQMLINSFPQEVSMMQQAYQKQDWSTIQNIAHKLKGGCSYVGAVRLQSVCNHLHKYLKEEKTEKRNDLYRQMLREIEAVKVEYEKLVAEDFIEHKAV